MRSLWAKRWFRLALVATVVAGLALVVTCWRFRVWSRHDYHLYQTLRKDYPMGLDILYGRVTAGQSIDEPSFRPSNGHVLQYGQYDVAFSRL